MTNEDDIVLASRDDFEHKRDGDGDHIGVYEPVPGETTECPECDGEGSIIVEEFDESVEEDDESVEEVTDVEIEEEIDGEVEEVMEIPEPTHTICDKCDGTGEVRKHIKVKPLTQGDANEYLPDDGDINNMTDRQYLMVLRDHVLEPDFSDLTSIEDIKAYSLLPLVKAVANASGFEHTQKMGEEMMGGSTAELVEKVKGNSSDGS